MPETVSRRPPPDDDLQWPPGPSEGVDVIDLQQERFLAASPPVVPRPTPVGSRSALPEPSGPQLADVADGPPRWLTACAWIVTIVASVAIAFMGVGSAQRPIATSAVTSPAAVVDPIGRLVVRGPVGGRVSVDGVPRGRGAMDLLVRPGDHDLAIAGNFGRVRERIRVEPGATVVVLVPVLSGVPSPRRAPPAAAIDATGASPESSGQADNAGASGWIAVPVPFEVQVFVDGGLAGTNRGQPLVVANGVHRVELVNESLNYRTTQPVTVGTNKTTEVAAPVPTELVSLNAVPEGEVLVDGVRTGQTPIGVRLPIGTHEVVIRHPSFGETRRTITVVAGAPQRISVDLRQ